MAKSGKNTLGGGFKSRKTRIVASGINLATLTPIIGGTRTPVHHAPASSMKTRFIHYAEQAAQAELRAS